VLKFRDARGVSERVLANKYSTYGETSAVFVLDEDISDFLTAAFCKALKHAGVTLDNESPALHISADILKFTADVKMGLVSGDMDGAVQVLLKIQRGAEGRVVWSAVVSGNSKIKDILADTEGNRRQAIESAVAQLMEKTLSDPGFVAAMKIN
jgi:hypothetical protein